jgi:cbb3-type cytochrome oxidase subunit 3
MFHRVNFVEWQPILTIAVFFVTLAVFAYFTWKAAKLTHDERDHMANLPLEGDDQDGASDSRFSSTSSSQS